jgi:UDP-glucose 4-epimerase
MKKKIFVTGGAGYIGSHTCVELLRANFDIMVFDDLSNSSVDALRRVELITNRKLSFVLGDIRNSNRLKEAISDFKPDSVVHFAGLKAVGQSVTSPLEYYDVNVHGSINLLKAMDNVGCTEIIFSSSATVYGEINVPPYTEMMPVCPVSPYGRTKLIFENILKDWTTTCDTKRAVILRYFNPVGAHTSGLLGEDPKDTPNNLMPLIVQTAQKKRRELCIYGADYDTRDGTGERDYIHVMDLALGHMKALSEIFNLKRLQVLNLGTGKGTTVTELIRTFEKTNNISVETKVVGRRPGDVAKSFADPGIARELIGFECSKTLEEICSDTWNWIQKNPNGYDS